MTYSSTNGYGSGGGADDYFDLDKFLKTQKIIEDSGLKGDSNFQKEWENRFSANTGKPYGAEDLEKFTNEYKSKATSSSTNESTPTKQSSSDDYFDIGKFESLLSRLEDSKGRQQRQKSLEGRRDIFSQGLAGMMSNF